MKEVEGMNIQEVEASMLAYEIASSWVAKNVTIPAVQLWIAKYYVRMVRRKLRNYMLLQKFPKKHNE